MRFADGLRYHAVGVPDRRRRVSKAALSASTARVAMTGQIGIGLRRQHPRNSLESEDVSAANALIPTSSLRVVLARSGTTGPIECGIYFQA